MEFLLTLSTMALCFCAAVVLVSLIAGAGLKVYRWLTAAV